MKGFDQGGNMYGEAEATFRSIGAFLRSGTRPNEVVFLKLKIYEKEGAVLADYLRDVALHIGAQVVQKNHFPNKNPFDLTLHDLWTQYGAGGKSRGHLGAAHRDMANNNIGYVVFLPEKATYNRMPEDRRGWVWDEKKVETGTGIFWRGNELVKIHDGQQKSADKYLGEKHEEYRDAWRAAHAPAQGQGDEAVAPAQGQGGQAAAHAQEDQNEPAQKRHFPPLGAGCVNDLDAAVANPHTCMLTSNVMNMCARP